MKLIELFLEDLDNEDEGVSAIALVDKPAIELPFHFFSKQDFDVNVSSLAPYVDQVTEDQPLKEKILEETLLAQPVASFDYDNTLSTQRGLDLARRYQSSGYKLIIITARNMSGSGIVYDVASKLGIPKSDVHFTNGQPKWITVQKLGVKVHIDNNAAEVRKIIENTNSDASLFSEDPALDSEVHELMIEVLASVLGESHRAEFDFIDQHRFKVDAKNIDRVIDAGELNSGDLTLNDGGTLKLRLRYRGPVDGKNRKLCAKLMTLNRLYTVNDVQQLNRIIPSSDVPRPAGGVIDLYQWKGGANCRHSWEQVVFIETTGGAIRLQSTQIVSGTNPPASQGKRGFSQFAINEEQRIVIGPAMIPDMNIDRVDENGNSYQVFFSKETVKAVAEKFARELRLPDTNIDHNNLDKADSYVYETWIVEDTQKDKSALYGFQLPVGSWMVAMKVVSDKTWAWVKQGYLTGFSIEGYFAEKEFTEA